MKNFKEFINESDDIQTTILEMCIIMDTDTNTLNEMFESEDNVIEEGIKDMFKGLVSVKQGRGLFQQLKSAGKNMAKLFVGLIKKDERAVKEVLKSITKQEVLKFIVNLDQATLHILSTPLHTLSAITGWHIDVGKIGQKATKLVDKIKQAIIVIKQNLGSLIGGKKKDQYTKYLDTIENSVNDPTSFIQLVR